MMLWTPHLVTLSTFHPSILPLCIRVFLSLSKGHSKYDSASELLINTEISLQGWFVCFYYKMVCIMNRLSPRRHRFTVVCRNALVGVSSRTHFCLCVCMCVCTEYVSPLNPSSQWVEGQRGPLSLKWGNISSVYRVQVFEQQDVSASLL